jgi:hypothetical protein
VDLCLLLFAAGPTVLSPALPSPLLRDPPVPLLAASLTVHTLAAHQQQQEEQEQQAAARGDDATADAPAALASLPPEKQSASAQRKEQRRLAKKKALAEARAKQGDVAADRGGADWQRRKPKAKADDDGEDARLGRPESGEEDATGPPSPFKRPGALARSASLLLPLASGGSAPDVESFLHVHLSFVMALFVRLDGGTQSLLIHPYRLEQAFQMLALPLAKVRAKCALSSEPKRGYMSTRRGPCRWRNNLVFLSSLAFSPQYII